MTRVPVIDRHDPVWDNRHWMHRHLLYRCYGADGHLLYIGASSDWPQRARGHAYGTPWWPEVHAVVMTQYPDRATAFRAERSAIAAESPPYNVAHAARKTA